MATLTPLEEVLVEVQARIARGQDAIAQRQTQGQEVPREWTAHLAKLEHAHQVLTLRSRLAELRVRLEKGMEVLRAKEEAGRTDGKYPLWIETWEKLLREYEDTADRLATLTGCPIGDCRQYESCATKPAPCLRVTR